METAIAPAPTPPSAVRPVNFATTLSRFSLATRDLGAALQNVPDQEVPSAVATLRRLETMLKENVDRLKDRALLYLNVNGQQVTEKGTKEVALNGHVMRAIPTRTGIDPKKLEAALRAKGIDPSAHMIPTITYKVDDFRVAKLVAAGMLTQQDLAAVQYDKSYRIEVTQGGTNE